MRDRLRRIYTPTWNAAFVFALAALMGCGEKPKLPPDLFPPAMNGGWQLVEQRDLKEGEAPDPVPRSAILQVRTATYKGQGQLEAHVYLLDAEETGRTLSQRWRPSADTVFFDSGRYFVVIRWPVGDRRALQSFVAEMQKKLGGVAKRK
jgi:hypothetical protein